MIHYLSILYLKNYFQVKLLFLITESFNFKSALGSRLHWLQYSIFHLIVYALIVQGFTNSHFAFPFILSIFKTFFKIEKEYHMKKIRRISIYFYCIFSSRKRTDTFSLYHKILIKIILLIQLISNN